MLKAILVRRDYIIHLKGLFPKMHDYLQNYGTFAWFTATFAVDEHGNNVGGHQPTGEEEDENAGEVVEEASETVASSYSCLKPLTQLCVTGIICVACLCCCVCVWPSCCCIVACKEKMMRNGFEGAFCRLAADAIIGKSLNLANQAMSCC